jgi:hypothetical protein
MTNGRDTRMRLAAGISKTVLIGLLVASVLAGNAGADGSTATARAQATPRPTTVSLDSFTLSTEVNYDTSEFSWCTTHGYKAFFDYSDGAPCPYQNYAATVHWKRVPNVTEYDVCVRSTFQGEGPGFACYTVQPPKSGSPAALSMTFDSAAMFLNAYQGTTQVWMVRACNFDPAPPFGSCSESNTVSAEIPWTG